MAPLVKRRINPEAIVIPNGANQMQGGLLGASIHDKDALARRQGNVLKTLTPEEEAKAAKEAGLVGRRIFVKFNGEGVTTVSWKKLVAAAGGAETKNSDAEKSADPLNPPGLLGERRRVNPLNAVIANLERQQMKAVGGSSSSEDDSVIEDDEEEENEVGSNEEKNSGANGNNEESGGSDDENSDSNNEPSKSDNESGDDSSAEKDLEDKVEKQRAKRENIGHYDYEDDFIDDSDVLELMQASKKRSKLDGFFVVKGKVETAEGDDDLPARIKVRKKKSKKRPRPEDELNAGSGKENGKLKKRRKPEKEISKQEEDSSKQKTQKQGDQKPSDQGKKNPENGQTQNARKVLEGLNLEKAKAGNQSKINESEAPLSAKKTERPKSALDRAQSLPQSEQNGANEENYKISDRIQKGIQSLIPLAETVKRNNEGVTGMSVPKSLNDQLARFACLLTKEAPQNTHGQEVIMQEVAKLFHPVFSKAKLRMRLNSLSKLTKDDMDSAIDKLQEHVKSKLTQAEAKRNSDPLLSGSSSPIKIPCDKNMDHYILTYATNYCMVHDLEDSDLRHLENLARIWPAGTMDVSELKTSMHRAISNPKATKIRGPRKSINSSDQSNMGILEGRGSDAVQSHPTNLPSIPENDLTQSQRGTMTPNKQRPNSNGGEENSSSEDTKTDSDSPLRSKQDPPTQNPNKPEPKFKPNLSEAESSLKTHREAKTPLKLQETPQSNQNPSQEANLSPQEARAQAKTQNSLPTGTNNTGENEGRILQIRDSNNEFVNNGLEEMLSRKENIQPNGSGNLEARKEEPRRLSSGNPILDRMQRTVDSQPNQPSNPAILPSKEAHQNSSNQGKYAWDPQLAKTAIGKEPPRQAQIFQPIPNIPTAASASPSQIPKAVNSVQSPPGNQDRFSEAALRISAVNLGADPVKIDLSFKKFTGHRMRTACVKVLLLAGSKGFNTQKIADLSNAHKLMGNEIIGETSSAKRKLYNSLKNCPSYILSIGNGYFAHSAFPGVTEAAEKAAELLKETKRKKEEKEGNPHLENATSIEAREVNNTEDFIPLGEDARPKSAANELPNSPQGKNSKKPSTNPPNQNGVSGEKNGTAMIQNPNLANNNVKQPQVQGENQRGQREQRNEANSVRPSNPNSSLGIVTQPNSGTQSSQPQVSTQILPQPNLIPQFQAQALIRPDLGFFLQNPRFNPGYSQHIPDVRSSLQYLSLLQNSLPFSGMQIPQQMGLDSQGLAPSVNGNKPNLPIVSSAPPQNLPSDKVISESGKNNKEDSGVPKPVLQPNLSEAQNQGPKAREMVSSEEVRDLGLNNQQVDSDVIMMDASDSIDTAQN